MLHKKRIAILLTLIAALLAYFWLGSRYPSIDEKAAMAGEFVLEDVLSFEAAFEIDPADPAWKRIGLSTLNWVSTNRQGMTFGVLLASLVLTLLKAWPLKRKPGRTLPDILKGILIGTPLGVCVNCAAPIAYGMRKEGVHSGTTLATMFSSPTLNIIVVTMMFSLLPLHLATARVIATFAFLLLILPLLMKLLDKDPPGPEVEAPSVEDSETRASPESWGAAMAGTAKDFLRSLLFIVIRTVPLMLLAGFLGTIVAMLVPMESLAGWQVSLLGMAAVALLGTFAPVPIAFDIILVQALLVIGLPGEYAMVLLITLGMFSIYPLLLVSRMFSWRFSAAVFFAVAFLGIGSGYATGAYDNFITRQNQEIYAAAFASRGTGETEHGVARAPAGSQATLNQQEPSGQPASQAEIRLTTRVEGNAFRPRSAAGALPFTRTEGSDLGLLPHTQQLLDLMMPFSQGRGLASGDFDNDGWPDLAVARSNGVTLYRNVDGIRFEERKLELPELAQLSVLVVALVDIDNDGCLDLYAGGFGDKDLFLQNDCEGFLQPRVFELSHEDALITQAAAFADDDGDGDLDLLKGNWFFQLPRTWASPRNLNYYSENHGDFVFRQSELNGIHGSTLAVLMSDFNNDGQTDRMIGNDFMEPDQYYRQGKDGEFEQLTAGGVIPITTLATMTFDTADIDNDLDFDLFQSGKVNDFSLVRGRDDKSLSLQERRQSVLQRRKTFQENYCADFEHDADRTWCQAVMFNSDRLRSPRLAKCLELPTETRQQECMITVRLKNSVARRDFLFCRDIPADLFPVHEEVCRSWGEYSKSAEPNENPGYQYLDQGVVPQNDQGNVLLVQGEDGHFADKAEEYGVFDGRWAWTAKFADLDHDEWQDLYLVNGWWLETSMYSNQFFLNQEGSGFESKEADFGLQSIRKQHAFTYLDMDRDGDLDIITRSTAGDMLVWKNNLQSGHSIMFEFRDKGGNHFGIGNKVFIYYGENGQKHQVRELKAGGGFVSFDAPVIHFGLGEHEAVSRIEIEWSTGERSELTGPFKAGQKYTIHRSPGV